MKREDILSAFENLKEDFSIDFNLKEEQIDIIESVLNKKDTMGILGTGFGKSMTYILPPLILNKIKPEENHVSLVISPLRSLMMTQVDGLTQKGISAAAILQRSEMTDDIINGIKNGNYTIVFASPEAINTDMWSGIVRSQIFRKKVVLVAVDEAHCVIQWGKTFREDYMKITWLRPVLKDASFLFLTATLTPKMKDEILSQFSVPAVNVTAAVPNRANIFLDYKCHPGMRIDEHLTPYIEELRENGVHARKCIVYTRVNPAGEIYEEFINRLGDKAYTVDGKRMVDVFVAKTSELAKQDILENFPKKDSTIRCLIASSAFGMGVDIPDIDVIIHWGVSSSVLDYWQEVGRCARDGRSGHAIMLATPTTVSDRRMTDDCMRSLHKKVTQEKCCIRISVLRVLYLECMDQEEIDKVAHKDKCDSHCENDCTCLWCTCCSNCKSKCTCCM